MTGADVLTGRGADRVRATWVEFSGHARGCDRCVNALAALLRDPTQGRHLLYGRCCKDGAEHYDRWVIAVNAMVEHLGRTLQKPRVPQGAER